MIIGVPKEVKPQENRISCTPSTAEQLVKKGHIVFVEKNAGIGAGFKDEDYIKAGATMLETAEEVWAKAELIYKVKEPLKSEYKYFREGLIIYTYLHLSANAELTKALVDSKVIGLAYESVQIGRKLPLLQPMSEVAGRLSVQEGARFLMKFNGGKGVLLQGVPGVRPANVVIIGAGIAGTAAAKIAVGMGARVTMINRNVSRLREICDIFGNEIETLYSTSANIANAVKDADLVVSTVLIPGYKAPKLITEEMVKEMEDGSVIVDVSIDQGGSTETTENHPTTHENPVFEKHGVIHYAVANMPGAVARTSTLALSNATTDYLLEIADLGLVEACRKFPELKPGINTFKGSVTYKPVAEDLNYEHVDIDKVLF